MYWNQGNHIRKNNNNNGNNNKTREAETERKLSILTIVFCRKKENKKLCMTVCCLLVLKDR